MNALATRQCVRCKRVIKINAHGRCDACYSYLRRTGIERPIGAKVKKPQKCVNCKREIKINARGRCSACYNCLMRNGVERPINSIVKEDRFCIDCKEEPVYCVDRCKTCYDYHLRYKGKRKRPAHLRNRHKLNCKNPACKKPLRIDISPAKGYCKQCYEYFRKRGVDRPAVLARLILPPGYTACSNPNCDRPLVRPGFCGGCLGWFDEYRELRPRKLCPERVDLGWCECGEIATTEYRFKVEKTEYALILCDYCKFIEESLGRKSPD